MRNKIKGSALIFLIIFCSYLLLLAQTEEYPHVMDNGGGKATGGGKTNLASIGQAVIGIADDGTNTNQAGYITAVASFEVGIDEKHADEVTPQEIKILQNFPNPFKENTTIEFFLPKSADVEFSVYNVLGKKLLNLTDQASTSGWNTIEFDAGNLTSGVYLYELKTGNTHYINRMVILE